MRKQFLGHFKESDGTVKKLWETAAFVFDANVLLNFYRYSDETRQEFLGLLRNIKARSWIPEQAAHEFLKNRATVIKQQISSYESALLNIKKIQDSFSGSRSHPFISQNAINSFEEVVTLINEELEEKRKNQQDLIHKDPIKEEVADLFEDRIGKGFDSETLKLMCEQGSQRYIEKIPPGYKDGGKIVNPATEADKRSTFGDWIIWKQILDYAASKKVSIIFVTDDRKEDWWEEEYGKTLGPRPELVKEFIEVTKQKVLFYTPDLFLQRAKGFQLTEISNESIEEVEAEHTTREMKRQAAIEKIQRLHRHKVDQKYENREERWGRSPDALQRLELFRNGLSSYFENDEMERIDSTQLSLENRHSLVNYLHELNIHRDMLMRRHDAKFTERQNSDEMSNAVAANERLRRYALQQELEEVTKAISLIEMKLASISSG